MLRVGFTQLKQQRLDFGGYDFTGYLDLDKENISFVDLATLILWDQIIIRMNNYNLF